MISVITPHFRGTNPYISECYESLKRQPIGDWEWVIVRNNGGLLPDEIIDDERVKVLNADTNCIGALKRQACKRARGDIIVEVDADDIITDDCLTEVAAAFTEGVAFVYSNNAEFRSGTWYSEAYKEYWGWRHKNFEYEGHRLKEMIAFEPSAHMMRTIWWAPNHVRAWRAIDYWKVGGHNPEMAVADDHELNCRFYLHGGLKHINKCLYLYRVHEGNTVKKKNAEIQQGSWANYAKYVIPMAEKWAGDQGLPLLDLGAAHNKPDIYVGLDIHDADVICDLREGIPYPDSSVGVVRAYDALEHLPDAVQIMNEIYRVLVPGGWLLASVPSTDGRGAFQDPTHRSFWNEHSFWYYTDPAFAKYVPAIKCKFQVSRVLTWYPSDWHKQHEISYVDAQLIAVKDGFRAPGECLWLY